MNTSSLPPRNANQAASRRLRPTIDATYPKGHLVAIGDDRILADAASFDELETLLRDMGRDQRETLVVRAGMKFPDYVTIFI